MPSVCNYYAESLDVNVSRFNFNHDFMKSQRARFYEVKQSRVSRNAHFTTIYVMCEFTSGNEN